MADGSYQTQLGYRVFDDIIWTGPPQVSAVSVPHVDARLVMMGGVNKPGTHVADATRNDHGLDALIVNRGGRGRLEFRTEGTLIKNEAAMRDLVAFIPNGMDTSWEMPHNSQSFTLFVPRGRFAALAGRAPAPVLPSRHHRLAWLGSLIEREMRSAGPGTPLLIDGLLRAIAAGLVELDAPLPAAPGSAGRLDPTTMSRIRDFLAARVGEPVTLDAVAQVARMPPAHFARAFRETTGQTLFRFTMAQRLALACELLADEERSLTSVALACGFAGLPSFNMSFARAMGLSPRAYRAGLS
ncbi:MAG: AraC family transcriptional regulator [Sphingomonas sp.]|nr:AraC family transcriptional regulator [Sphingomonas sp.]